MPSLRPPLRIATALALGSLLQPMPAGAQIWRPTWLSGVTITEYQPALESDFAGRMIPAPGIGHLHYIGWLYSARGVAMEGEGIALSGNWAHIDQVGSGWINRYGYITVPGRNGWSNGAPAWLYGTYWLNAYGHKTFPGPEPGEWTNGYGRRFHAPVDVTFAPGQSRPLHYYRSIAVDPRLIPLGSRIYIRSYRWTSHHGWFVAADTGGAIQGRHVDVFRPPSPSGTARYLTGESIYVVPPG
jgi:3D (Asp-Asp-Asp) domain-containing protein